MIHLFLDTNILLNFYSYEGDRLDQLTRLTQALESGNLCLHLPQQVINEFVRNREQKIKVANEQFSKEPMQTAIPRHMQSYPQAAEYLQALESAKEARKKLINLAVADASNQSLQPDVLLNALIDKATKYAEDDIVFAVAVRRAQKGNPPGKNGSVGDQYNWEMLLREVPSSDLYIVSRDGDYASLLNKALPHPFLKAEWKERKGCELHIFQEIKPFLDRYEQILVQPPPALPLPVEAEAPQEPAVQAEVPAGVEEPNEAYGEPVAQQPAEAADKPEPGDYDQELYAEKAAAIDALVNSSSFASTHAAVSRLGYYRQLLTKVDVERLIEAAVNNLQIRWIATDSDVYAFFASLITGHSDINSELFEEAVEVFGLEPDPVDPFDD